MQNFPGWSMYRSKSRSQEDDTIAWAVTPKETLRAIRGMKGLRWARTISQEAASLWWSPQAGQQTTNLPNTREAIDHREINITPTAKSSQLLWTLSQAPQAVSLKSALRDSPIFHISEASLQSYSLCWSLGLGLFPNKTPGIQLLTMFYSRI